MAYTVVEFKAGETIFRQGEPGTLMFLLQGGQVEVIQELMSESAEVTEPEQLTEPEELTEP